MFRSLFACTAVIAALTGCTTVVDGSASMSAGSVTLDGVDADLLDTGDYPTAPLPAFGAAGTTIAGALVEAARLATYVVLPSDVDPALVELVAKSAFAFKDAEALHIFLPAPSGVPAADNAAVAAAKANGYVTGFASVRQNADGSTELMNGVLVFPDAAAASAAAVELVAAEMGVLPEVPKTPQPIAGRPDTTAFSLDLKYVGRQTRAYTPYERYVLFQTVSAPTAEIEAQLVAKTLHMQQPLLADFTPTDPAKLVDLPRDPTGLLARTLPEDDYQKMGIGRVREPAAALHYQGNPVVSGEAFDEAGVVRVATARGDVYETSQDDGGARLVEIFAQNALDRSLQPEPGVNGMPGVQCFSAPSALPGRTAFGCYGSAGKYAFEQYGGQLGDVQQMMAAQYLMLTAP